MQEALPAHLRGAFAPALFGGQGAAFGPESRPFTPGQQGAPMQFGNGGNGAPAGNVWTFERVQQLPPGNNDAERIFAEVVRTEFDGKAAPGSRNYDLAWARAGQIHANLRAS